MKECPTCRSCYADRFSHCRNDGDRLFSSIAGDGVLDGRYELKRRLGQGGMGSVYEARHSFLKTVHAVKVISPEFLEGHDPEFVRRFRQEAMAAANIRHRNVIRVTDFGVADGIMPFLVMDFIRGKLLQDILTRERILSPEGALGIIEPVALGVGAAHRLGIVHRDLKPLNIIVEDGMPLRDAVKVLDFGLAKIKAGEVLGSFVAAKSSGVMGSPPYMAPEQWSDEEFDSRTDIYSMGIILYQMLAGDVPFKGPSAPSIMKKHLMNEPPRFADLGAFVPPQVEAVVRHALEKDPADRPQSAEAFIEELHNAIAEANAAASKSKEVTRTEPIYSAVSTGTPIPDTYTGHAAPRRRADGDAETMPHDSGEGQQLRETEATPEVKAQEYRRRLDLELAATEELARQREAAEAAARAEEEERLRREEEDRLRGAEEERLRREEEERLRREEEERVRREEEARRRKEQEERKRQEEERERRAEEERRREEARLAAEAEEARRRTEAEEARRLEEERLKREEEELLRREEEERLRREEEERLRREEEERLRREEEERVRREAEARRRREEEERVRREAEAKARREEEERLQREEAERLARQAEERRREGEERRRAEEAERRRQEEEARKRAEEAERRAAVEAARRREEEEQRRAVEERTRAALRETRLQEVLPAQDALGADEASAAVPPVEATHAGRRSRVPLLAVAALAALVGLSGILYLLFGGRARSHGPDNPATVNSAPTGGTASPQGRAGDDPAGRQPAKPDMAELAGGTFLMGRSDVSRSDAPDPDAYTFALIQYPAHPVAVKPFLIDRTEVTNAEYADFVRKTGYEAPKHWGGTAPPSGAEKLPVVNVSFLDAQAFARWRSERDGVTYRLPTEEEWEFAARGTRNSLYPWGNAWAEDHANLAGDGPRPVGSYLQGASEEAGVLDLIGNVWEWTSSEAALYPGNDKIEFDEKGWIVVRGGSYLSMSADAIKKRGSRKFPATVREWEKKNTRSPTLGFRLVRELP